MIAKLPLPFVLPTFTLPKLPRWVFHQRLGADELKGMSDHELRDLGLGRSEIDWAVDHGRDE